MGNPSAHTTMCYVATIVTTRAPRRGARLPTRAVRHQARWMHIVMLQHIARACNFSRPRHESKSSRRRATQRLVTAPSVEDACFPTSHVHTSSSKLPHGSALMYSNNTMLRTGLGFSTPCRAPLHRWSRTSIGDWPLPCWTVSIPQRKFETTRRAAPLSTPIGPRLALDLRGRVACAEAVGHSPSEPTARSKFAPSLSGVEPLSRHQGSYETFPHGPPLR